MTDSDLALFIAETRGVAPRKAAARYFPAVEAKAGHLRRVPRPGSVRAIRWLRSYARELQTARACRLRGEMSTALHYEENMERIYTTLPAWARW